MKRAVISLLICLLIMAFWANQPEQVVALKGGDTLLGNCTGTTANVTISSASGNAAGEIDANGSWSVGGGADGIYIKYYVDDTLYQSEHKSGTSGSWSFSDDGFSSGNHTFKITGYAKDGSTICWTHYDTETRTVNVPAASATITSCSWSGFNPSQGTCTGTTSSGTTRKWTLNDSGNYGSGLTSNQITCYFGDTINLNALSGSTIVATDDWPCGVE